DALAHERRQWIAEMELLLQGRGPLQQTVTRWPCRGLRHNDRLRAAGVGVVGINVDRRKHGTQGGQGREVKLRAPGDVGRNDASRREMVFDERVKLPRQQVERNAELAKRIQQDDVVAILMAIEINAPVALDQAELVGIDETEIFSPRGDDPRVELDD